jgi:hypothetical protein
MSLIWPVRGQLPQSDAQIKREPVGGEDPSSFVYQTI